MTATPSSLSRSLLAQIEQATNFTHNAWKYTKFFIEDYHIGFLNSDIQDELKKRQLVDVKDDGLHLRTMNAEERSRVFAQLLNELRQENKYCTLRGWRNELYSLWVEGRTRSLMNYERSAAPLFGFTTYGIHVNGYLNHPDKGWCMWVGRRSETKPTYPNKLDQMGAGGLSTGLGVLECCIKECGEEASLSSDLIAGLRPTGTVTCFYVNERGVCPECEYIFDIELPADFQPACQDGEMQSFLLLPYQEVLERIAAGEFKLNCGIICLDFLIRHGFITPDSEPYYNKLISGIHPKLPQD